MKDHASFRSYPNLRNTFLVGTEVQSMDFDRECGDEKNQFPMIGLATRVNLLELSFSPNGKHLAFILSSQGRNSLYVTDLKEGMYASNLRNVNASQETKPSVLYGGGHFCWDSKSERLILANKEGLWSVDVSSGRESRLLPATFRASAPVVSESRVYYSSMLEETMVLSSILLDTPSLPIQESEFHNFIIDPACSSTGSYIAWHEWDFPYMPWDESRIVVKALHYSSSSSPKKDRFLRLEKSHVAFSQPVWHPNKDSLVFLSDQTGWLNIWIMDEVGSEPRILIPDNAEHGYPTWLARRSTIAWNFDGKKIFHIRNSRGETRLACYDLEDEEDRSLGLPSGFYEGLSAHPKKPIISFVFSSPLIPPTLCSYSADTGKTETITQSHTRFGLDKNDLTVEHFEYNTTENQKAYGILWYSQSINLEKAPIVVNAHGGPTSQRFKSWTPTANFFSTRGYLYIELNYRGSTGYGREYTQSLNGHWGKRDTEDAVYLLRHLESKGIGDTEKSVIMGGSAGGFLVLNVMTKYPRAYSAGIARAPVTDLFHLARHTHYFESHYDRMLVGDLPEDARKYREYSPIFHAEKLDRPLMIIQGEKDIVVPKEQVDEFVRKATKNGAYVSYLTYPLEGHGIERKENLIDMYTKISEFIEKHVI